MVGPTPPPPIVSPHATSHQEIKDRSPVTKPDTANPVGATQESDRSKKVRKQKENDKDEDKKKQRKSNFTDEYRELDITV